MKFKIAEDDYALDKKEKKSPTSTSSEGNNEKAASVYDIPQIKEPKKVSSKKQKEDPKPKNLGGRPTNEEKGIKSRKQYTLTLKEDTYKLILEKAGEEDLSFAKFMERAALEYIKNHK